MPYGASCGCRRLKVMPKPNTPLPNPENPDALARLFDNFDFRVAPDDFIFYEVGQTIEEDRASFDDADFRQIIDWGIRVHIDESAEIRAQIAAILRTLRNRDLRKTI